MNELLQFLTVFVLSVVVGFEVISKVPSILHTPLMSGSNAIHGVILVGAMIVLGSAPTIQTAPAPKQLRTFANAFEISSRVTSKHVYGLYESCRRCP